MPMKKFTFLFLVMLFSLTVQAQVPGGLASSRYALPVKDSKVAMLENSLQKHLTAPQKIADRLKKISNAGQTKEIITKTPAGDLQIYTRSGYTIFKDENEEGSISMAVQQGSVSMVFAENNVVYIQDPVSMYAYGVWAKGTYDEEEQTITLPLLQEIDSLRTFGIALCLGVFDYDTQANTYVLNDQITEVTYNIGEVNVTLNGTTDSRILSLYYKVRDDSEFSELNGEWIGYGDFWSIYYPFEEEVVTPPAGARYDVMYLTTSYHDRLGWKSVKKEVSMAVLGSDVYLQGLCDEIPEAWVQGTLTQSQLTIYNEQFLGVSNAKPVFFLGANMTNMGTGYNDVVCNGKNGTSYITPDYFIFSHTKDVSDMMGYFIGVQFDKEEDEVLTSPAGVTFENYEMAFKYYAFDSNGNDVLIDSSYVVKVGFDGNNVYLKGLCTNLPGAVLKGTIANGKATFASPQYFGSYRNEYDETFYMHFLAFDNYTYETVDNVVFTYDATEKTLKGPNVAFAFAINKVIDISLMDVTNVNFQKTDKVFEIIPATPLILAYLKMATPILRFSVPPYSTDDAQLDTDKLFYRFMTDDGTTVSPVTLTKEQYTDFALDVTVIPYDFWDGGYDVDKQGTVRIYNINFPLDNVQRLGVQSIYRYDGSEFLSEIGWYDLNDTGIGQTTQDVEVTYTDLLGRSVKAGTKGILLRTSRTPDGRVKTGKVIIPR